MLRYSDNGRPLSRCRASDRAASFIWRHRRYQTMIPGRPGWPPHGRVLFNSLFLLDNIPDCISDASGILYDLIFLD